VPLRCVSDYKSSAGKWSAGEEVTGLTAAQVAHILNDSPASFADVPDVPEVVTVAPVAPPVDKIMRRKTGA
jgi:hypothetical protein